MKKPGEGICPICGNQTPRKKVIIRGYKAACCEQCHKILSVQNWRESQKRNHNGGYYSGTQEFRDRRKKDCQEQFGCDYYWQAKEIKEKRKQSMLEHHGVEHKINYEYQSSTTFKWIDYTGKERTYIPDFKLITENGEQFIEIKGDHFFDKNGNFFDPYDKTEIGNYNAEQKYNCMINNGVKILLRSDLIELGIKM